MSEKRRVDPSISDSDRIGAVPEVAASLRHVVESQAARPLELRALRSEVSMEEHSNDWTHLFADGSVGPLLNQRSPVKTNRTRVLAEDSKP
jgi:hypothetical protein